MCSLRWCHSHVKLYAGSLILYEIDNCTTRLGAPYLGRGRTPQTLANGFQQSVRFWTILEALWPLI